ncbi:MAG: molybdopterin-dependent oxidoreductase [Anaerolineales bacterium]|jgi:DMSO/TMAO reductase YedYZ molybdopterin-dependent catalytic subunit
MKRTLFVILVMALALTACAPKPAAPSGNTLKVTDGTIVKTYTVDDLKALGAVQASDKGVAYIGVPLKVVLQDAGIDPTKLSAVKAVASDGFTSNYDPSQFLADDTLVAYARADGPLTVDEGIFRMVLPDQGGILNPRLLIEIDAIQ